jgi:hypothetical protein
MVLPWVNGIGSSSVSTRTSLHPGDPGPCEAPVRPGRIQGEDPHIVWATDRDARDLSRV